MYRTKTENGLSIQHRCHRLMSYKSLTVFHFFIHEGPSTENDPVQRHTLRKDGFLDRKGGILDRKRSASRPRKFELRNDSRSRSTKTDEVLSAGYHSEGIHVVAKPILKVTISIKDKMECV